LPMSASGAQRKPAWARTTTAP
jgi:hypothetical protein